MNKKIKIAESWSDEWLEIHGPQPFSDMKMQELEYEVLNGQIDKDISDKIYDDFITETELWIKNSNLNNLTGFDSFNRRDICIGCTHFIDDLYMKGTIQYINGDYKYHERLNLGLVRNLKKLDPTTILTPFSARI